MKALLRIVPLAALTLGGCVKSAETSPQAPHGRYAGVGIYPADRTWTKMSAADKPKDGAAATVGDDQTVIVVVDSDTGELRQCGNMSGYCTAMNPWKRPIAAPQTLPVQVSEHAPEKKADGDAPTSTSSEATLATNAAATAP